ncbi:hypothetical protein MAPG_05361 [Magnaporthiopsis poae ATCC 64411]|uniref:Phosphoribosylaminoimidazole-succinocarboxamide synthase n=1 Tax=Magnaporthiopsis poae (strain ATCC 64411 / 73-15) TaxID=644358 RepID=A0A0C4DZ72_MAGP6|nr:hypothetical protein MAPG_05361 [Magnaporthiopsis poae ATCC 64411]
MASPTDEETATIPAAEPSIHPWLANASNGVEVFDPLTAAEEAELPELNFRPLALKPWYLWMSFGLFSLCFAVLISLVTLDRTMPPWFDVDSTTSYQVWLYAPGVLGFITALLSRGTIRSYNRIIPYVRMASSSSDVRGRRERRYFGSVLTMQLAAVPGEQVNLGQVLNLWICGDYVSCLVNITMIFTALLTPLKANLFQLVQKDVSNWKIDVNFRVAVVGSVAYLFIMIATLLIICHLRKRRTGLKWSPTTLAAQLALIQGSDVLDELACIDTTRPQSLSRDARTWPYLLHLGYWKERTSRRVVYGVRFHAEHRNQSPPQANPERETTGAPSDQPLPASRSGRERASAADRICAISDYPNPRHRPGEINRLWNYYLLDWFLFATTAMGVTMLLAATIFWARGDIYRPFHVRAGISAFSPDRSLVRFEAYYIFSFLPGALIGLSFHMIFLAADLYNRTMAPIVNMASRLSEEGLDGVYPRGKDKNDKTTGATALRSMLLDYLDPNPISCVVNAVVSSDFRIAFGMLLATLNTLFWTVQGRLFYLLDDEIDRDGYYMMGVSPQHFYAVYAVLVFYCISIWLVRPRGPVRTCRPIFTLLDLAMLVHKSRILQCPEFSVAPELGEDHLRAQVVLASRIYRFGFYQGINGNEYVGISPTKVPEAWVEAAAADPVMSRTSDAAGVASLVLRHGLYDPEAGAPEQAVEVVDDTGYFSWTREAKRVWAGKRADAVAASGTLGSQ